MQEQMTSSSSRLASIVIPTYNRKESLELTLESVVRQSFPFDRFDVIIVDDGGSDNTKAILQNIYPFELRYFYKDNEGSAVARNYGALRSDADILIFIDDDVTLHPDYLTSIIDKISPGVLVMGVWEPYEVENPSHYHRDAMQRVQIKAARALNEEEVPFTECTSNNLAVCRQNFVHVGMWQDVLGDGPTLWGDVEFGYRAWKAGSRFVRLADARIVHRDQHAIDLNAALKRAFHVARLAPALLLLHPELEEYLDMFHDKDPISLGKDSPKIIIRKLIRQLMSSGLSMKVMEKSICFFENRVSEPRILHYLYRWIKSGYVYRGYREGLSQLGN